MKGLIKTGVTQNWNLSWMHRKDGQNGCKKQFPSFWRMNTFQYSFTIRQRETHLNASYDFVIPEHTVGECNASFSSQTLLKNRKQGKKSLKQQPWDRFLHIPQQTPTPVRTSMLVLPCEFYVLLVQFGFNLMDLFQTDKKVCWEKVGVSKKFTFNMF